MEWKNDIIYGVNRKVYKVSCYQCNSDVWRIKAQLKHKKHFCSKICKNNSQKTGETYHCLLCNKEVYRIPSQQRSTTNTYFCSRVCSDSHRSGVLSESNKLRVGDLHPNYAEGSKSYRKRAFRYYGKNCENPECPIGIPIPEEMLDVDHIDSNRERNCKENLQVLCVWCHAVKTRLKIDINARIIQVETLPH